MEKWLGKNLLYLRKRKDYTQMDIAKEIGIKPTTWSMYEQNKSQPNLNMLIRISKFFEVSESELLHFDLSQKNNSIDTSSNILEESDVEYLKGKIESLEKEIKLTDSVLNLLKERNDLLEKKVLNFIKQKNQK